jgi:hypothetical protein
MRAKSSTHAWQLPIEFRLRFRPRGTQELLVPFHEEVRNPMLLRHEQKAQLVHGSLRLVDGFLHQRDASLGFLDGPFEGLAVLADNSQQLFAQSLQAAVASGAKQIRARAFYEALQALEQFFPIAQRAAFFHPFGGAHLKHLAHRAT